MIQPKELSARARGLRADGARESISACFLELVQKPSFWLPILMTTLLSYGFFCANYSVSIDDLSGERYVSGELLSQGRFTWTLFGRLLKVYEGYPFFEATFFILLLAFSVMALSALFRCVSGRTVPVAACSVFSCLFLSYPLLSEAFSYQMLPFALAFGNLLIVAAVYGVYAGGGKARVRNTLWSALCLMFATSLYESLLICYVFLVFAVLLVQLRAGTSDIRDFRSLLATGLRYLVPMALGIAAEALVSKAILLIARLPDSGRAATLINWTEQPFRKAVKELIRYTLIYDVIYALIYLPIAMLVGSAVLLLGYAVSDIRRYRRAHVLLVYLGLFLSLGLLALIQGAPSPRRVQFVYPYFVAFTGLLVTQTACRSRSGWKRRSLVALMALLVFYQAEDISHWFALDYQRFDNERAAVREIGYDLRAEKGYGKPVVFCGGYYFAGLYDDYVRGATSDNPLALSLTNAVNYYFEKESQQRLKIQESSDILYIPWSYFAWGDFSDLIKFFKRYGFDITVTLDPEIRKAADQMAADMPTFPVEGYIRDAGDYLVVHLGE